MRKYSMLGEIYAFIYIPYILQNNWQEKIKMLSLDDRIIGNFYFNVSTFLCSGF